MELLFTVAALAMVAACALPALAGSPARSQLAQCLNNLRQIGRAMQMFSGEHGNQLSWRTPAQDGGEYLNTTRPGNAWVEYAFLSNQVVTPRILACPADTGVRVASQWPEYTSPPFRNNAISYPVNLHAAGEQPTAPLATDHNLRVQADGPCGLANVNNTWAFNPSNPQAGWTNTVHGLQGNIVQVDGSVATTSSETLRKAFANSQGGDQSSVHILGAR